MSKKPAILTSFMLTLFLSASVNGQGIMREVWTGIGGTGVSNLTDNANYPDNPSYGEVMPTFEAPVDFDDNFGSRLHGYLIPATSGDYKFWIATDDNSELWLSTDEDPANAVVISSVSAWAPSRAWDDPDVTPSAVIPLVAGQKYYISAIYKEGGGGDNCSVAWEGPDSPTRDVIAGAFLEPAPWAAVLLKAGSPVPADGEVDFDTGMLEWTAGPTAVAQRVYFSTDATIDDADLIGEPAPTLNLQVVTIDPGKTYYWRVDEVEADGKVWEGDVWSFTTLPKEAHFPVPADGTVNVLSAQLSWVGGKNAIMHNVHFGEDPAALVGVSMMQMDTSYDAGMLEDGKTFYWRVDEFTPMGVITGPVWSFTSPPLIEVTDPNLIGAWTFEEGEGMTVVDYSGHGNHGIISGAANQEYVAGVEVPWMPGLSSSAMDFLGDNQGFVELPGDMPITAAQGTIMMWINTTLNDDEGMLFWAGGTAGDGYGGENEIHFNIDDGGTGQLEFFIEDDPSGGDENVEYNNIGGTGWRHVAVTWDLTDGLRLYVDGLEVNTDNHNGATYGFETIRLGRPIGTGNGNRFYDGIMDEVMLYDYALSADQITPLGRNVDLAYNPSPSDGAGNQPPSADLAWSWTPGFEPAEQDVYISSDLDALNAADATDTTGIYLGRQAETSITVATEWGTTSYWRVDKVSVDGSTTCITTGPVWSLTGADFVAIDLSTDNLDYDNRADPYVTEAVWDMPPQATDWTLNGVTDVSLRFRGLNPVEPAGSTEHDPVTGVYTITAAGADIWNLGPGGNRRDEFRYVYWQLEGDGSMTVRVTDNGTGSNAWAKGGVMIRQSVANGAANVLGAITGGSGDGATFQWREVQGQNSGSSRTLTGIAPPYWVRLTRVGNDFTCEMSADGVTWELEGNNPHTVVMTDPVLIGLALTSHEAGEARTFTFDNLTVTGDVTGEGQSVDIGGNTATPIYMAVEDAVGNTVMVVHPDPAATQLTDWTNWKVAVSDLAAQGLDPTVVSKLIIGTGDGNPGGTGNIQVDDISVVLPPEPIGAWSLDEGSGATAGDSSGSGLDGAVIDAVWASPGFDGADSCLDFDGQGTNMVDLGNFDVTTGNGLSISLWYKADNLDTPGDDPRMFSKAVGGATQDHWFMLSSSRVGGDKVLRFRLKTDGNTGELKADAATGLIDLDVWTHVAAVWDGAAMKLYKNGVGAGSVDKGGTLSTNPDANVAIGNQPVGTDSRPWDGLIDEVKLYDRGLSIVEVGELAGL